MCCSVISGAIPLQFLLCKICTGIYFYHSHTPFSVQISSQVADQLLSYISWSEETGLAHSPDHYTKDLFIHDVTTHCYFPLHFRCDLSLFPGQWSLTHG